MSEWKDCEHIFSNGTEFEIFYDHCLKEREHERL